MERYKSLFKEIRRNSELNPHIGVYDYIEMYKDDPDVYISFTQLPKLGINPNSNYKKPFGVYCYPLKEFVKNYIKNKKFKNYKLSSYAPFSGAKESFYIYFIKSKSSKSFIDISIYSYNDLENDLKKLKKLYPYFFTDRYNQINNLINKIDNRLPFKIIWEVTKQLAQSFNGSLGLKWNIIFQKNLGYSGFVDRNELYIMSGDISLEALFLNTHTFDIITVIENKPAKNKPSEKETLLYKYASILDKISNESINSIFPKLSIKKDKIIYSTTGSILINTKQSILPPELKNIVFNCKKMWIYKSNLVTLKNIFEIFKGNLVIEDNKNLKHIDYLPDFIEGKLYIDKKYLEDKILNKFSKDIVEIIK